MKKELIVKNKIIGKGKPLVCVPVIAEQREDIVAQIMKLAQKKAQMIEWRVDAFCAADNLNEIRNLLAEVAPYLQESIFVYTFRSKKQGGFKDFSAELISDIHQIGAKAGCVDFVDLEFFEARHPQKEIRTLQNMGVHVIASHHDFSQTPDSEVMRMILERMKDSGVDVVKLAVMPQDKQDVIRLLNVTAEFTFENPDTPAITMSMGQLGCISRIAGETFGSCVTFGADVKASAPGQLPMDCLENILQTISCE